MNTLSSWPLPFAGNTLPRMGRIANHNKDRTLVKLSGGCRGKVACASSIGQRYPASNNEARRTPQPKKATGAMDRTLNANTTAYSPTHSIR